MKLTSYTDYALRLLMYLAIHKERLCTIGEVSRAYGISKNHLMKLVCDLSNQGSIETVRGRSGGLRLRRPPEKIKLGALVQFTEESVALVECFNEQSDTCAISNACRLKGILQKANAAFLAALDEYTLADLVIKPAGLKKVFEAA